MIPPFPGSNPPAPPRRLGTFSASWRRPVRRAARLASSGRWTTPRWRESGCGGSAGQAAGSRGIALPIIIKDNINTAGFPTTAGTPFLKNYRPKANAPLADMLFKQGAILFAKSNMHELALGSTSANPTFGYVKNPYDLSRIPGGSNQGDRPLMNCAATSLLLRNADQCRATSRTPDLAAPPIWNERRCARPSDRLQFDWSRLRPSRQ